jgi:hypothetical protein
MARQDLSQNCYKESIYTVVFIDIPNGGNWWRSVDDLAFGSQNNYLSQLDYSELRHADILLGLLVYPSAIEMVGHSGQGQPNSTELYKEESIKRFQNKALT